MGGYDLIAVGTSWGGLRALGIVLGAFPPDLAAAVAVVQHRGAGPRSSALVALLARRTRLSVREVEDENPISPGAIYLAPPDYHLLVEPEGFALSLEERVHYSRPSIDALFESAADTRGERLVAVVLTGANADGAARLVTGEGARWPDGGPEPGERRAAGDAGGCDRDGRGGRGALPRADRALPG